MFIPMAIANMPAGNVAIEFGFKGECEFLFVTACASSTHAIGEAYKTIKLGAGRCYYSRWNRSCNLRSRNCRFWKYESIIIITDINRASIPFDKERNGFVMGEGAGMLVLEELEHAKTEALKYMEK